MKMGSSAEWFIEGDELLALIRERLAAGQTIRYLPFRGVSMMPMLRQGKDTVEIAPLPEKLQKYDLPVYQYPSGKVVMHRVVGVKDGYYVCLGDNTYSYEKITPDMLIGKVTAFKRGEKRIEVTNSAYRLYVRIWVALYPLRKVWRALIRKVKDILRPIVKPILRRFR